MQSSFKIIKGLEKKFDCRLIELRHSFIKEPENGMAEKVNSEPAFDYSQLMAVVIREAEEKARKIVTEARNAAFEIVEIEKKKAEEESEKRKNAAAQEGFEEGRKEALAKAAADASSIRDQARSVLRQAEEIRRQTLESMEPDIVRLAIEISEKLVSSQLNVDPGIIVEIAREAIGLLHNRDRVVVFVNPSEESLFEERRSELEKCLSPRGELLIVTDSDIKPGGCIAETQNGRVDARLDSRWEALLESLGEINR